VYRGFGWRNRRERHPLDGFGYGARIILKRILKQPVGEWGRGVGGLDWSGPCEHGNEIPLLHKLGEFLF
jgi:hypothetical protein